MTFDEAMAQQVAEGHTDVSPEAWYIVMVADHVINTPALRGLSDYVFSINPPNPDIIEFYAQKMPPHEAAQRLFSIYH